MNGFGRIIEHESSLVEHASPTLVLFNRYEMKNSRALEGVSHKMQISKLQSKLCHVLNELTCVRRVCFCLSKENHCLCA